MTIPFTLRNSPFVAFLLIFTLISACKGGRDSALDDRIKADKELLQTEHAILQVRMDSLTNRYSALVADNTDDARTATHSTKDLERADMGLGNMKGILEADERFIREHAQASAELTAGTAQAKASVARYDEMMQGHARMLEEFHAIADKLEQNILKPQ